MSQHACVYTCLRTERVQTRVACLACTGRSRGWRADTSAEITIVSLLILLSTRPYEKGVQDPSNGSASRAIIDSPRSMVFRLSLNQTLDIFRPTTGMLC
ncbi:hypothetical protein NEOLEDRAFT_444298 [Neolentinus lepideus HHB14362 ss-1]|uniref:Uncharacterized protein n=1 Tax=Neolentinus lepideus HHB14362 ss-1 TaxID=1314782 RepID=A0A165RRK3_9AGAM|nr:hypothetical protein NEOLEDRAFT_444298 [Neolentinus lepideus HHB14362 ss-1]